jgi:putative heme-binding domain-containing protein
MKRLASAFLVAAGAGWTFVIAFAGGNEAKQSAKADSAKRVLWQTSHITGSPEPPAPYRMERVFPKLEFKNPLLLVKAPGTDRLFVAEQAGPIYSFKPNDQNDKRDLLIDMSKEIHSWGNDARVKGVGNVYGLVFHPDFVKNRYCYICYVLDGTKGNEQLPEGSRVSRFRVTETDPPRVEPESEKILLTFLGGGHNAGDLHFGPDGYLYISTGDATDPSPPDKFNTGQDISDLLSSILRIDVNREAAGKPYAIPADNPFVKFAGARPEVWAYGFRNPWRMSFDRATGDLWVGDVGWELWEMIYHVRRGGNYGWSVMEGPQPVRPESKRGPTPILPPAISFPHSEAASITGGYVYRGKRLPELAGCYICGDWMSHKIWATRFDGDKIVSHREIAHGIERIVAFGEDADGELYIVNYDDHGTIHRLVPNDVASASTTAPFPRKLSATGLFASVKDGTPAAGVMPFSVNATQWADQATAERWLGLPGSSAVSYYTTPKPEVGTFFSQNIWFPRDGVLAKTLSLEMERGNPASRKRIETQVLHWDGSVWQGYSYRWNDDQTDGELVPAVGADRTIDLIDAQAPEGKRRQTWHYPGRSECMTCHNPWVGYLLGFNSHQLNKDHTYPWGKENQLEALTSLGLIRPVDLQEKPAPNYRDAFKTKLCDPHDASHSLVERARAYLHVNCGHCHAFGAGGTAQIELRYDSKPEQQGLVEKKPMQGTFDLPGANLVTPGDPYRSVLFYRISKLGRGRMPHIGSDVVDDAGVALVGNWIRQLGPPLAKSPLLTKLEEERSLTPQARETIAKMVATPDGALELADALREGAFSDAGKGANGGANGQARELLALREAIVAAGAARPESTIHDLFEPYLPVSKRVKRLGSVIHAGELLSMKGDVGRGREIFKTASLQCVQCHRVGDAGGKVGPELTQIGKKYSRAELLENILEPSKKIEPAYVTHLVETDDGRFFTGVIVSRSDKELVLRDAADKEQRIPTGKVANTLPQPKSLMPDQLLRDLTAQQAADLLEYLSSLK